ncbi:MAG: hypothetical protein CMC76_07465 [Flavobacteriaceae bacterium]|nr:hypothetical protein [Flavobacteriaceae bacterium]
MSKYIVIMNQNKSQAINRYNCKFLGIGLLFIIWALSCKAQNNNAQLVPFKYEKNQIIVETKLNGKDQTLYMLLDTGVDPSVIDLKTAEDIGLNIQKDDEGSASGRGNSNAKVYPVSINQLMIQDQNYGDIEGLTFDMSRIEKKLGRKIHGILGYCFLKNKIFRIDYAKKTIEFFNTIDNLENSLSDKAKKLKFITDGEDMIPLIEDLSINGHQFIASFDTGSSLGVQIYEHRLADVKLDTINLDKLKKSQLYGAQGKKKTVITSLNKLTLDSNIVFKNLTLTISSIKNKEQLRMGNIGNKFLENFRVTFDFVDRAIILENN